jgi:hypothetical protein
MIGDQWFIKCLLFYALFPLEFSYQNLQKVFAKYNLIPSVNYLIKAPAYIFILIFFFPSVLLGVITTFLPEPDMSGSLATDSVVLDLIIAVIVAPLIETLLLQSFLIEIICRIVKRPRKNICIAVMVSALAFALNHTYCLGYIIMTFFWGIIFAIAYYLGRYRKESAIILVFLIHSFYNLSSSLYNLIF